MQIFAMAWLLKLFSNTFCWFYYDVFSRRKLFSLHSNTIQKGVGRHMLYVGWKSIKCCWKGEVHLSPNIQFYFINFFKKQLKSFLITSFNKLMFPYNKYKYCSSSVYLSFFSSLLVTIIYLLFVISCQPFFLNMTKLTTQLII